MVKLTKGKIATSLGKNYNTHKSLRKPVPAWALAGKRLHTQKGLKSVGLVSGIHVWRIKKTQKDVEQLLGEPFSPGDLIWTEPEVKNAWCYKHIHDRESNG